MKKPTLLFALKCAAIVYVITFTNIEKFTIAPTPKQEQIETKAVSTDTEPGNIVANNFHPTKF